MVPRKKYSCYVSEVLDRLGYSYDMIKYRQQLFDKNDRHSNRDTLPYTQVTTGSKGEGTSMLYESDCDSMHIVNDVICADNPQHFIQIEDITLFHTERQEAPPGYTRLKLLKFEGKCLNEGIRQSLFQSEPGSQYLSSKNFTDACKIALLKSGSKMDCFRDIKVDVSGPSTTLYGTDLNTDSLFCFTCLCPDILEHWVSRPRNHGWPSPDTIHEISLLDGHVVPVGMKGSQNMYREWRICYSLAELHLMRNLNESQLKVYILLKKITKSALNPVCKEMTSYIMKNVLFWMCEANGVDMFTEDMLIDILLDCIELLRACVIENSLPSYMIPNRNLLAGRLDIEQRQQLTSLLGDLLHEGGRILLRCEKLRDAMLVMYQIPEMFRDFSEKRDEVESLLLIQWGKVTQIRTPEMPVKESVQLLEQDEQMYDIKRRLIHLLQFDKQALQMGEGIWNTLHQLCS